MAKEAPGFRRGIGGDALDGLAGGWLRARADAGPPDHLLPPIAVDGNAAPEAARGSRPP